MSPDRDVDTTAQQSGESVGRGRARVLLFMEPGRNRTLLQEALAEEYRIETTTAVEKIQTTFDCCIFDTPEFNRVAGTIQSRRDTAEPVFLPFVLLSGDDSADSRHGEVWEYVDDIISIPEKKQTLRSRIRNLVKRRQTSLQLAERERELEATVEDLKLKERAMDAAPVGITITEAGDGDNALIYVNEQFESLTGYSSTVVGEDSRFLKGEETNPDTVERIREALDAEK